MKKKSTFQNLIKEAEPIAEEIYKIYRYSEIARKLLQKYSFEDIKRMTENKIMDACNPEVCDAALVVVCATIIDNPKVACQSVHKDQLQ